MLHQGLAPGISPRPLSAVATIYDESGQFQPMDKRSWSALTEKSPAHRKLNSTPPMKSSHCENNAFHILHFNNHLHIFTGLLSIQL